MPNILVIDDDKILTMLLEAKLIGIGVDIVSVHSANDALKVACGSSFKPALILLDLNMPKVSGLDLLETLKSNSELHNIPVIIITSSTDEDKLARAQKLGALDFIKKPIETGELFEKIIPLLQEA